MRPIVTDRVAWFVGLSVCLSVTIVSPVKIAEPIEMPFGTWIQVSPRNHELDGGAQWHHLANTIEQSMCGGDAAFLSNYFDRLFESDGHRHHRLLGPA